jgi:hypothetical protein
MQLANHEHVGAGIEQTEVIDKEGNMGKIVIGVTVCLLAVLCTSVYAHPPSDITITFDSATKMLKAVITHPVSNPDKHYINMVDIAINGKEIIGHVISRQDNGSTQTVSYLIPDAKKEDILSVEGYCSISGKLTRQITVEK